MAEFLLTSDPKSITPAQYRKLLRDFIEERLFCDLEGLVLRYSGPSEHTSFIVSCHDLIDFDPSLGYNVIHFPKLLLPIFDEAIFEAQTNICSHSSFEIKHGRKGSVKINCHIRIVSLPPAEYLNKPTISDIRADDVESLIQISGKVVRTGAVRMLETSKKYECQNPRCMYRFTILADPEQNNMLPQPRSCPCPSTDSSGVGKKCHSTNLRELEGYRVCVDYQELKIQDSFERVSLGSIPRSIAVILEANLVDKFNAGDDVVIVGELVRQWKPVWKGARCVVDIALRANSILALNAQDRLRVVASDTVSQFDSFWQSYRATDQLLRGRDVIIRSICPQLYGLFFVKLALLLTLVGGSATQSGRGVKRRSQSHMLVVGDPGCGKSQILRFAASVVSRSVLTTGIGTSGAGLTCTAVRDGTDWSLEAGALVLANDGVCCIDEFASIKDQDRVTIHEAMEQQSISVAKAGLVVKLNTRATVLACCNPKGTYDVSADISTNTAIASPLLSRFDLVLVLLDSPQKEWDKRVSTFLLQQAVNAGVENSKRESRLQLKSKVEDTWDLLKLRDYISYVKHHFQPTMSKESQYLLMRYYQMQRQSEERSSGRTTVRLLESLMRLSEAHAKIMSREVVLLEDAVVAIACVNLSQEQSSLLDTNSTLHSDFPHDPKGFYEEQEAKVFALLHCTKQSILRDIAAQDQEQKDKLSESKEDYGAVGEERKGLNSVEGGGSRGVVDEVAREVFPTTSATAFSDEVDHTVVKNKNKNMDEVTDVPTSSTFPKEHHPISGHDKSCTGMGRGDSYSHCKSNWAGSDNGGDLSDPAKFSDKLFTNGSVCNAWGGDDREEFMSTAYSTSTDHSFPDAIAQMIPSQISNHDLWTTVSSTADTLNEFDRGGIINQSYRGDINGIMGQGRADINWKTDSRLSQPDSLLQSSLSIQPRPRKRGSSGFDGAAHQPSPSSVHYHTDRTHTPLKVSATKISRTVANSERGNCTASLRSLPQLPPGLHRSPAGTGVTSSKSDNIHGRGSISRSPISVRKRLRTDGPETDSSRREEILDLSQNASMYHSEKNQENSFPLRDQQKGFDRSSDSDMREIGADQNLFGVMSFNNTSQLSDANTTQGSKLKQTQVQVQEPLATQDSMSTATAPSNIFLSSIGDAFDCEDW